MTSIPFKPSPRLVEERIFYLVISSFDDIGQFPPSSRHIRRRKTFYCEHILGVGSLFSRPIHEFLLRCSSFEGSKYCLACCHLVVFFWLSVSLFEWICLTCFLVLRRRTYNYDKINVLTRLVFKRPAKLWTKWIAEMGLCYLPKFQWLKWWQAHRLPHDWNMLWLW